MNNNDFTNFISSMLSSITTTQVLTILAGVIGVGMTFFLMWLGVRLMVNRFTKAVEGGNITGTFNHEQLREALITNSAYSEATMKEKKTIGQSPLTPRPIEPKPPSGEPMTKEERKAMEDWDNTHYRNGGEIGFDLREYWYFTDRPKWYKWKRENNQYKKKKYNNYKKKNYYYDSHGNKYYK